VKGLQKPGVNPVESAERRQGLREAADSETEIVEV
jgi:hypothetical protein